MKKNIKNFSYRVDINIVDVYVNGVLARLEKF